MGYSEYNLWIDRNGLIHINEEVGIDGHAAHSLAFNGCSCGIALEGDFARGERAVNDTPTDAQWDNLTFVLSLLVTRYGLKVNAVRGHTEMGPMATAFPSKLQTGDPATGEGDHSCPGTNMPMNEVRRRLQKIIDSTQAV